jgi:hypothetical protein
VSGAIDSNSQSKAWWKVWKTYEAGLVTSVWFEAGIEAYENSDAHKQIVQHTRSLKGFSAVVKLYELAE